jgi:hypothetical protein
MAFHSVAEWTGIAREFGAEKDINFGGSSWDIFHCDGDVLVWETSLLKLSNPNMIEDRAKDRMQILHEGGKILLESSHNKIWTIIC